MHTFTKDFEILTGRKLPLSGGLGQSRRDAVVIDAERANGPVSAPSIEYAVLDLVGYMKKDTYVIIEQHLLKHGDQQYDQLIIEWGKMPGQLFSFYFDITSVFKRLL